MKNQDGFFTQTEKRKSLNTDLVRKINLIFKEGLQRINHSSGEKNKYLKHHF